MCQWGDTINQEVTIAASCSHTGTERRAIKPVDRCIADIVEALNRAGLPTGGSCCGHGKTDGYISLLDGRVLRLEFVDPDQMQCSDRAGYMGSIEWDSRNEKR